jgi:hypothetical protein
MDKIKNIKSISLWIFIVPFIGINTCLITITQFQSIFPNQEQIIHSTFPYFDGGASISRTARPFPNWLIFKPTMFLTSFLLVKYWLYNKEIIQSFNKDHKYLKKVLFFGIGSAIALTIHSIFLGIKFDNDLYKLFRRVIMLSFIIFEIVAQAYLVLIFYSFKNELAKYINQRYLKIKLILVSILAVVGVLSIPLLVMDGNKFLKHGLEWNYFIGVITFYLLTHLMWNKKRTN